MNHCFNLQIANKFDTNVAIFLQSIAYWTHNNLTNKRNLIDGHCWTYNSLDALQETFTYWSIKQLKTVIKNAVNSGLLIKGNHNKNKYDRTCWYSLSYEAYEFFPELCQEHFIKRLYDSILDQEKPEYPIWANGKIHFGSPIPNTKTNTKDIISDNEKIKTQEVVQAYHETLPNSPKIRVIGNDLSKQIRAMIKNWSKYQKEGKPFSIDSFVDYLNYIKNHYSWFLKPYQTETGKIKRNNLTNITREKNIVSIVNGEFSVN